YGTCENNVPICICLSKADAEQLVTRLKALHKFELTARQLGLSFEQLQGIPAEKPVPSPEFRAIEAECKRGDASREVKKKMRQLQQDHQKQMRLWTLAQDKLAEFRANCVIEEETARRKLDQDIYDRYYEDWYYNYGYYMLPLEESKTPGWVAELVGVQ